MSLRVEKTPAALADLDEIGTFIGQDSLRAELGFYDAAQNAFERLAETPGLGAVLSRSTSALAGLRRWRVPRFGNYLIFYRVTDETVTIVRVLHGARDIERILQAGD
jgi:toxin ParE1/3/4